MCAQVVYASGVSLRGYWEDILYYEDGEALAQVTQRSCGCSIPGNAQDQAAWDLEQPGLVNGVPAYGRGVGTT